MQDLKIDDSVKINGGKSKKCEGTVTSLKKVFVLVTLTKDKKGEPMFCDKPIKVKRTYIEVIPPPAIEMPTQNDCVAVDNLEPCLTTIQDLENQLVDPHIETNIKIVKVDVPADDDTFKCDSDHENSNPNEKKNVSFMINENNKKVPAITMDDAFNLKRDNEKLNLQLQSMMSFQGNACEEIAELQLQIKELKEQLEDTVPKHNLEMIRDLLDGKELDL